MFIIEDSFHTERVNGEFDSFASALEELQGMSEIPYGTRPNVAPCASWKTCHRTYEIIEYDILTKPWKEIARLPIFDISAEGIEWHQKTGKD